MNDGLIWRFKRGFWSRFSVRRFKLAKQRPIELPKPNGRKLGLLPCREVHRDVPLSKVLVFDRLPKEENKLPMRALTTIAIGLNRLIPQTQPTAEPISPNIDQALSSALTSNYREVFRPPVLPVAFAGADQPDLAGLATTSPYAVFLERLDGHFQWDFRQLGTFEHHADACSLGLRVVFDEVSTDAPDVPARLTVRHIDSDEFGCVMPGDPNWTTAARLAVCAASTHLAMTRHFNYVHLICANHWAVAARNHLRYNHPLYRLVWPHMANSLYTNYGITRGQLRADGDFTHMFSFTHAGLIDYFDTMYEQYPITITDPVADRARRGLDDVAFDTPSQRNLEEVFEVMHAHARRYIHIYYESDEALRADDAVRSWLGALDASIPNGIGAVLGDGITRAGLARLVGGYIFEGNTMHDLAGTTLWDYQLWAGKNPTRVLRNGRSVGVDVYQRVVNNNFGLQLKRAELLDDYSYLAIDQGGVAAFHQFFDECKTLQRRYDDELAGLDPGATTWCMQPKNLEISMNG